MTSWVPRLRYDQTTCDATVSSAEFRVTSEMAPKSLIWSELFFSRGDHFFFLSWGFHILAIKIFSWSSKVPMGLAGLSGWLILGLKRLFCPIFHKTVHFLLIKTFLCFKIIKLIQGVFLHVIARFI